MLLYTPRRDRLAVAAEVEAAVSHAREAWVAAGANASLEVHAPDAPSDLRDEEIGAALKWLEKTLQL